MPSRTLPRCSTCSNLDTVYLFLTDLVSGPSSKWTTLPKRFTTSATTPAATLWDQTTGVRSPSSPMMLTKGLRRSWRRINMADMLNGNCHQIRRNQLNLYQANMTTSSVLKRKPSPIASNRPNAIICKFVRRLTREEVMTARRRVSCLNADDWGYNGAVDVSHVNLFNHLTPRMQGLLFESKKFKDENNYKYCWAKNGFVYLRKTDTSTAVKLSSLEDLQGVVPQSWAKYTCLDDIIIRI